MPLSKDFMTSFIEENDPQKKGNTPQALCSAVNEMYEMQLTDTLNACAPFLCLYGLELHSKFSDGSQADIAVLGLTLRCH